ncbi:MATE family efflux transporter [Exiguobacterium chiriqhucha]|uniref:hypothetical protein n=1 Tax=Exiguobacterium chiriqhucha TaxID=1385984 RepID=UPI0038BBD112
MNSKTIILVKNIYYTFSANFLALFLSSAVILIIPKMIGVADYGYWQLYLFYSSYVGFLHFGWNDGIYLKLGGANYKEIDKAYLQSQFWSLFIFQLLLMTMGVTIFREIITQPEKNIIVNFTLLCMFLVNTRLMLVFILESTNRIREYSKIILWEKLYFSFFILIFLLNGIHRFEILIVADLLGKVITLIYSIYFCRDFIFYKKYKFKFNFLKIYENITIGIKLMVANISSMLIIGVLRLGIERNWDVSTFGKVSLTLSLTSLLMVFINSISIVMFPALRRTDSHSLPKLYFSIKNILTSFLFLSLIIYYPLKIILNLWIPEYSESLRYMALLFPLFVFEAKMSLLINPYFKTLRYEKTLLAINLFTLVLSMILTIVSTFLLNNLTLAILSMTVLMFIRYFIAEMIIATKFKNSFLKDSFLELLLILVFIYSNWYLSTMAAAIVYICFFILVLIIKKIDINNSLLHVKLLSKNK